MPTRQLYSRAEVAGLLEAYQRVLGPLTPELRTYWGLERTREWSFLTTDYVTASYAQLEELSRLALDIEARIVDPVAKGEAMREASRATGVGFSMGACPWTDHGLHQTFHVNRDAQRVVIILGHDWYPIVPRRSKKPHPIDVPLWKYDGLHGTQKYISRGAVPRALVEKREVLLFLNLKPDYRPPNTDSVGRFVDPNQRYLDGLDAMLAGVSHTFKEIVLLSWGSPVWELLRERVGATEKLGMLAHAKSRNGQGPPLELQTGLQTVRYLPMAHPCDLRNFDAHHRHPHAHEGFIRLGLGGGC